MKKVATFVRVSDFDTAQIALYNQKKKLQDYCESKGYEVVDHAELIGDKKMGYQTFMNLLQNAKTGGAEKIVMQSTNRVIATLGEVGELSKLLYESGVELETLDGSHEALINPAKLTKAQSGNIETKDVYADTDEEVVFGYDRTDDGVVVNESEMEVVKYCFTRFNTLCSQNPSLRIDEVTRKIEDEIKEKWPVEYEALINKNRHNAIVHGRQFANSPRVADAITSKKEPLISEEEWADVQEKIAGNQGEENDEGQGMVPTM